MSRKANKARAPERSAPSLVPYSVDMTATAEAVYKDLFRKAHASEAAGDHGSTHCTTFNMVRDAIKQAIPADPLNKKYALRGTLSNLFRLRKGRMRICWIASSRMRRICILFISETLRKDGDAKDPDVILQNMVESGTFDTIFSQFAIRIARLKKPDIGKA